MGQCAVLVRARTAVPCVGIHVRQQDTGLHMPMMQRRGTCWSHVDGREPVDGTKPRAAAFRAHVYLEPLTTGMLVTFMRL